MAADIAAVTELLARQCQAIDGADFTRYGLTFTEDAVFENLATGQALRSRDRIVASAVAHRATRDAAGAVFRHYVSGTVLDASDDGSVLASSTTLIVRSDGSGSRPMALLSCRDHVVMDDGVLRIALRRVAPAVPRGGIR